MKSSIPYYLTVVETAKIFGIDEDRAVDCFADAEGTDILYDTVGDAVFGMRRLEPLGANWSDKIKKFQRKKIARYA